MNVTAKQHKAYITGLKGMACILIMVGHFLGIYKYAQVFPQIRVINILQNSPLCFLIDEGYWLYLFFVISGYLLSKSKIDSPKELFTKSVLRFFRLAVPILFSYFMIYIIFIVLGFHNRATIPYFRCDWFQKYYVNTYSIIDVFSGPIKVLMFGQAVLNSPYWVLRMMFVSSIIIYVLKYIVIKCTKDEIKILILFIATLGCYFISPIVTACLIGMLVSELEEKISLYYDNRIFAFCIMLFTMALYFFSKQLIASVFFGALIIFIPNTKLLNSIFESKPLIFFGDISWGIYSFHWPIVSSVGVLIFNRMCSGGISTQTSYLIAIALSVIITVVVAIVYYLTFEKITTKILSSLRSLLKK